MSLWGNLDAANNAPKQSAMAGYSAQTPQVTSNSQVYYANTQLGAFSDNQAIGIFGVSAAEQANSSTVESTGVPTHAGWVIRKAGTGGRAGRIQVETIVAMGSMIGDAADDVTLGDTAA